MTARWRGHSHPELYKMINSGPGAGASDAQTQYWASLTDELAQVDADLNRSLSNLGATWEGPAAQGASASLTPLQAWAGHAQSGSAVMRISSENQADYISTARAEMPKPVEVTTPQPSAWQMIGAGAAAVTGNPGPAAMVAMQAVDNERQEAAQAAAAQKAVDTMDTYESNSTWNANTLGTFVRPPDVVVEVPPPRGDTSAGGVIGGWLTGSQYGATGGRTTSSITTTGGTGGTPAAPPAGSGTGSTGPGGAPASLPGSLTTPAAMAPPVPAPGVPPAPSLPGGGGPTTPGPGALPLLPGTLPGDDERAGGSNQGGRPGAAPGPRGVPGGVGGLDADGRSASQLGRGPTAALGAPGGEGVIGRGGGPGAAGAGARGAAFGGAPMGARASGDEDEEHFSPDYLLETTDVFGDERMVSPAVIGENPHLEEK